MRLLKNGARKGEGKHQATGRVCAPRGKRGAPACSHRS
jgi:hypothetical protein